MKKIDKALKIFLYVAAAIGILLRDYAQANTVLLLLIIHKLGEPHECNKL